MHTHHNNYKNIMLLCCLTLSTSAYASSCPTLSIDELPKAACSTKQKPFTTGSLASVKFYATSSCPTGIGLAKGIQSVFKDGKKTYAPVKENTIAGEATCKYTLNDAWKTELNTKSSELILTVAFPTRQHANYWYAPMVGMKCPVLSDESVPEIKQKSLEFESKKDSKLNYVFKVSPLVSAGLSGSLSGGFAKLTQGKTTLPLLQGTQQVTKQFEASCTYQHKTFGKETTFELKTLSQ